MTKHQFTSQMCFPIPVETLFAWHRRSGAFERLAPPWEQIRILERSGGVESGATVLLALGQPPFQVKWKLRHEDVLENKVFHDCQLSGPFLSWHHAHRFKPQGADSSVLEDVIEYEILLSRLLGKLVYPVIDQQLTRLFAYRYRIMAMDFALQNKGVKPMKIAITGSSGLVGEALVAFLTTQGHNVIRLVRTIPQQDTEIFWDYKSGCLDTEKLEGMDVVIHLAGENIADGRWSDRKKQKIMESRVTGTRFLSHTLASLKKPPQCVIAASAIGYYGNRADELLTEESTKGSGFLSEVCEAWEEATRPLQDKGIRVVNLRIGIVLSPKGGALGKMLPIFKLGGGGNLGDGRQYMSWITLDDLIGIIYHTIQHDFISGPVNAVAPNPVRNAEFTKTLGAVLTRPTLAMVPAVALRLTMGEMADALLLSSSHVKPQVLEQTGYVFHYPELKAAICHLLGKEPVSLASGL